MLPIQSIQARGYGLYHWEYDWLIIKWFYANKDNTIMRKLILTTASMGMVAFGFFAWLQAETILIAQNNAQCFDTIGITTIWTLDIGILVLCTMASTLCSTIVITEVSS